MSALGRVRADLVLGSKREVRTVGVVAGMCGFYASTLMLSSDLLTANARRLGGSSSTGVVLDAVALVFIGIAIYVAAIVIVNGVDAVVAGRLRHLAVLRLLGADVDALRAAVVRGCASVASVGAVSGVVIGTVLGDATRTFLVQRGSLRRDEYSWFAWPTVPSALLIVLAAGIAAWFGSRAVLQATPAQALRGSSAPASEPRSSTSLRHATTVALTGAGSLLLVAATILGERSGPVGFIVVAFGSMVTGSGILVGAGLIVPSLIRLASRLLGADPPSALAARNAVRNPGRTTRSTVGLVIGVALVTTFATGFRSLRTSVRYWHQTAAQAQQTYEILRTVSVIMICVVVVSSAIAAVGFVSTTSLSVIQRTREIGLLRALGFTSNQVRTMVIKESVAIAATAVTFGMAVGIVFGAAGSQALVGSRTQGFVWGIPGLELAAVALFGMLLVLVASWAPSSRAVSITPVEALKATT